MEPIYVIACGMLWRERKDADAGCELLRALLEEDSDARELARDFLESDPARAVPLLGDAISAGALTIEQGERCAGLLRMEQKTGAAAAVGRFPPAA